MDREGVAEIVKNIIVEEFGSKEIVTLDASFTQDLGLDELDLIELIIALEDKFGIEIPDEDVDGLTTVQKVVDYLEARGVLGSVPVYPY